MMDRKDLQVRSLSKTCTSGDTSGILVPANMIAHIKEIEYDTAAISGMASSIKIQIVDKYTPTGGTATEKIRKQFSVDAGDVGHIDTKGDLQIFTRGDVRSSCSGPTITMAYALE
jgi:hypothetical protein